MCCQAIVPEAALLIKEGTVSGADLNVLAEYSS